MTESQSHPRSLNAALIKPAGPDCNLGCDYCFYLEKSRLFRDDRAHRMTDAVLKQTISQLMALPAGELSLGWQGGEPTLMGLGFFERAIEYQKQLGAGKRVGNSLQTNGLLLDGAWARFFARYNFLIGLSLDGPAHIHDHHRKTRRGAGTFTAVVDNGKRLMDAGVPVNSLSVVTDYSARFARETYAFLKSLGFTHQQFIPCVEPPRVSGRDAAPFSVSGEAYGEFLVALFDSWNADFVDGYPAVSIRFFDALLGRYLETPPTECTLLETCGDYLVIEHNGDVFPCDFFVEPRARLGNLMDRPLPILFETAAMREFGLQKAALPADCRACRWKTVCRGGCPKDRPPGAPNHLCVGFDRFFAHAHETLERRARHIERAAAAGQKAAAIAAIRAGRLKVGRNDPCPCGSGRKFKKCCLHTTL